MSYDSPKSNFACSQFEIPSRLGTCGHSITRTSVSRSIKASGRLGRLLSLCYLSTTGKMLSRLIGDTIERSLLLSDTYKGIPWMISKCSAKKGSHANVAGHIERSSISIDMGYICSRLRHYYPSPRLVFPPSARAGFL